MKLYFNRYTRATRPRWLLEELGVPYELVDVDLMAGEHKTEAFLRLHPLGKVPALVDGEMTMFESAAICLYLADRHLDRGLAPPFGAADRGPYYQWMVYSMSELEPPVARAFYETRKPDPDAAVQAAAREEFEARARVIADTLADRPWLLGERFSAADVMIGAVLTWSERIGLVDNLPTLKAYNQRCIARPAFQAARR